MPGYNFKAQFADDVESGKKAQTIRPRRKRPTKVGDMLYMFTGMRTKQCRKLGQWRCTSVEPIEIYEHGIAFVGIEHELRWLSDDKLKQLARDDGFKDIYRLYDFFSKQYGIPAKDLEIIKWDPKEAEKDAT